MTKGRITESITISRKNKNVKLPSLEKSQTKTARKEQERDEQIIKSGIYIIKDLDAKKIKMPKYTDFRLSKEDRPTPVLEESPKKRKIRRHINVAGGHPLAGGPIRKAKKKNKTERN